MTTYSISAPNGKTYSIDGPAGASDDQVRQQVMAQHPDAVSTAAPASAPKPAANDLVNRWQGLEPAKARALIDQNMPKDAAQRARYQADPRIVALAKIAGTQAPRPTLAQRQQQSAGQRADRNAAGAGNFLTSLASGIRTGMMGVPDILAAGAERLLPASVTGNNTDATFGQILDQVRANEHADQAKSTAGAITGNIIGGLTGGGFAGSLVKKAAVRAASAATPIVAEGGNIIQNLLTMKKGATLANAGKLVIGGGVAGAAQAAGTGENVVKGAEYGAGGAAALGVGAKVLQAVFQPIGDFLRMSNASTILGRLTTASRESIEARIADYRLKNNGAEPTVFEMLPLVDRNKILKHGVGGNDNIVEQTMKAVDKRAGNLGPEMAATAHAILDPQRAHVETGLVRDLTAARGNAAGPVDTGLAHRALSDSTDMNALRDQEASAIMAPHQDTHAADNLVDLIPHIPGVDAAGNPIRVATDPEIGQAITSASAGLGRRLPDAGISAGEISSMITNLRRALGQPDHNKAAAAARAILHLEDELAARAPEAAAAHHQMNDAFALRSRMGEGMNFGAQTKARADFTKNATDNVAARKVRNAYDTAEGSGGRVLGQSNKILTDLAGSPEEALASTIDLARGKNTSALTENLGADAAARLKDAARSQADSADALSSAVRKATNGDGGTTGADVAGAIIGLHPGSFIGTKANSIHRIMAMTHIPESRARVMVEMLFSQDRALQQKALDALTSTKGGPSALQSILRTAGQLAGGQGGSSGDTSAPAQVGLPDMSPDGVPIDPSAAPSAGPQVGLPDLSPDGMPLGSSDPADPSLSSDAGAAPQATPTADNIQIDPNRPYGRQVIESLFPGAHINDAVRDPNSKLGRENPNSHHVTSQNAVDVRPIPGMKFGEFLDRIHDAGYQIVESIDEVNHPSKFATGKHWHVVVA